MRFWCLTWNYLFRTMFTEYPSFGYGKQAQYQTTFKQIRWLFQYGVQLDRWNNTWHIQYKKIKKTLIDFMKMLELCIKMKKEDIFRGHKTWYYLRKLKSEESLMKICVQKWKYTVTKLKFKTMQLSHETTLIHRSQLQKHGYRNRNFSFLIKKTSRFLPYQKKTSRLQKYTFLYISSPELTPSLSSQTFISINICYLLTGSSHV